MRQFAQIATFSLTQPNTKTKSGKLTGAKFSKGREWKAKETSMEGLTSDATKYLILLQPARIKSGEIPSNN